MIYVRQMKLHKWSNQGASLTAQKARHILAHAGLAVT